MQPGTLAQIGGLILVSFAVALVALWLVARIGRQRGFRPSIFSASPRDGVVFLFDDVNLVNATEQADQLLAGVTAEGNDWQRFVSLMGPRFEALEARIESLPELGHMVLTSHDGATRLIADWRNGLVRISVVEQTSPTPLVELDRPSFEAMQAELETLRATAESAPFLVWRQRADGTITWANSAYLALAGKGAPGDGVPVWPPARLFDLVNTRGHDEPLRSHRVTTHISGETDRRWFECFESRLGDESLFMAVSADKVVKAEVALRDFIQTLTKTFAHLTVGLAIFDKQRRLTLFNPALADLTALPVEFLSGRPTLLAVLNRLRENKMVPEPKDYKSWRQQLHELEAAAVNGTYEETWSLANGSTYRVVGRPHPEGALAFLFEDISAEISLTRRFRAERETGQAVLDALDEAIAVFSPGGSLILSNAAYSRLWGVDTDVSLADQGINGALAIWGEKCAPSSVWSDARAFVGLIGERHEWSAEVRLLDGRRLSCRFKPISGGATLVGFRSDQAARQDSPRPRSSTAPLLLGSEAPARA